MGFSFDIQISALTVFLQGIVSFFSPCILPLLPLYIGYLSGGTKTTGEDGRIQYDRRKVMGNTLFFVVGVSFAFLLLGLGMTAAGRFFHSRQQLFARIGGGIVFLFGLYQLGVFGTASALEREYRLPFRMEAIAMSPVTAFLMGFTFSFAWTPCVGPALASVLLMAASASTQTAGLLLIGVYTAGFVLPFLAVGFFAASLLGFFKRHGQVVKYTVKAGGVLMLLMGALMFTGKLNPAGAPPAPREATQKAEEENEPPAASKEPETEAEETLPPAIDFTLTDQFGNSHTLSDYKGKVIFLNFWATWCPPCRAEMPDIQKIYEEYQENGDDSVVILGVAGPSQGQEQTKQGITDFLEENGYTYPVLMDESGEQFAGYGVYSLPTTFMIDAAGNVFGYVSGRIDEAVMRDIIRQTLEGKRH